MDEENFQRLSNALTYRSKAAVVFESGLTLLIITAAFLGNLIIICVVYQNPRLRTVTNMFLVGLSVADFLTSSLVMPFTASIFIHGKWMFSKGVCVLQGILILWLVWTSLHMVTLMAINRYFCVRRPNLYRKWFTKRNTIAMIITVGVVSFILAISPYWSGLVAYIFRPGKAACFMTFDPKRRLGKIAYTFFLLLTYTILPMVCIAVCYYKVFRVVKEHAIATKNTIGSCARRRGNLSLEETRMTKLLLVLVVAFLVCWIPVITVDFLNAIMGTGSLPRALYVMYIVCAFGSSCINPIVCLSLNAKIRREAKKIILFKRLRQVEDMERTIETKPELTTVRVKENEETQLETITGEFYESSAVRTV